MSSLFIPSFRGRVTSINAPSQSQTNHLLQLESSTELNLMQPRSESCALFNMHGPESMIPESLPGMTDVDIVAVHGLGGDPYRTWQHENGFNWLEHLHEELSSTRVYSFGYDSSAAFSANIKGLTDHARYLLILVKRVRISHAEQNRKLVFVCHGLGGLLVRQAILLANNERGIFGPLREAFCDVLFLGTPHPSSNIEAYADDLCLMANEIVFPTPAEKLMEDFQMTLLKSLRNIAQGLVDSEEQFREYIRDMQLTSFNEKTPLPGMSDVLVDKNSNGYGYGIPMLGYDHRQICKHPSFATPGIWNIINELGDIIQRDKAIFAKSQDSSRKIEPQDAAAAAKTASFLRNGALLRTAATGNVRVLERLISQDADINTGNSQGETALLLACRQSFADTALRLLDAGADVNQCDLRGDSPLHLASRSRDSKLLLIILNKGCDPNRENRSGVTPLHVAAEFGGTSSVRLLLDHGSDCFIRNRAHELPAAIARRAQRLETMKVLQSHAQHVKGDKNLEHDSFNLSKSAKSGALAAVTGMLDQGVKPTAEALYAAAERGHSDVVQSLADVVDDIDTPIGFLGNALCAAAACQCGTESVRALLERGADINWTGGHYGCALQAATANYRLDNVILLVKYGADVNAQCGHYGNVMTAAARHTTHFTAMSTLFLERGADIDAQGPGVYGNALQTAVYHKHTENVQFLLQNGASPTVRGRFGSAKSIADRNAVAHSSNEQDAEWIKRLLHGKAHDKIFDSDAENSA